MHQDKGQLHMRVYGGRLLFINEMIRHLQCGSDATSSDDTTGALRAISGNEPCEKETQLELETESAVTMRSAA
jgi:hypothetical protein